MPAKPEIALIIQPIEHGPPMRRDHERRRDPRWPFRTTQLAAFHDEHQKPAKETFQQIRCHDISLSGLSFYLDSQPPRQHCTLILGRPPELIIVTARIVHSEPAEGSTGEWIIGCEFVAKFDAFPVQEI